ncbi:MAG: cytochrome P450 [Actinomycetia bacterium]|nr:cytochrome P450 [Actinomycetes bacterium]
MKLDEIDLLDLDRFVRGEHHEMFRVLREEAPVHWHDEPDGTGFWSITKLHDLQEVNRDVDTFSSEIGGTQRIDVDEVGTAFDTRGQMLVDTDPPRHTRYRRIVNKGFTPRMIGLLEDHLRYRAELIVDDVIENGNCDFVADLAAELPLQAIAELMGVPQEDRHLIFEWSNTMIGSQDPDFAEDEEAPHEAAMALYAYSNALAAERRESPRDDIVTKLLNADIDGEALTELEFDMFMMLLSVAGNETTRTATAIGMNALFDHPEQMARLQANLDDDDYMLRATDEILRWSTPVLHFRRTAAADTEVRGQKIAKGDKVLIWHVSANRDEEAFDDPFTFDIERADNEHVAFGGGGAHFCLGANLARVELRIIFREVLSRIPDLAKTAEPKILRSNFVTGIKTLPVEFSTGARKHPVGASAGG